MSEVADFLSGQPTVAEDDDLLEAELPHSGERIAVGAISSRAQLEIAKHQDDNATSMTIEYGRRSIRMRNDLPWASGMDGFMEWWEKLTAGDRIFVGRLFGRRNYKPEKDVLDLLNSAKVVKRK